MYAFLSLFVGASLLAEVSAVPGASRVIRQDVTPTPTPWVTVDASGQPKTITPTITTISGKPSVISGAPNDLTGSEFTQTNFGQATTSTGEAPQPTADANGAGAFQVCHNTGELAPFCEPKKGSILNPGKTIYITWNPDYFNGKNTTVVVTGSYFNITTGSITTQAFQSPKLAAGWSFYAWAVDNSLLQGGSAVNISLTMAALSIGNQAMEPLQGPIVTVANPEPYRQPPAQIPQGAALYIGLPVIGGFVALMLIGTCIWNRKTRKIALGNIMSRSRHGYGVSKSRVQRMAKGSMRRRQERKEAIKLMEREVAPEDRYRDAPTTRDADYGEWEQHVPGRDRQPHLDFELGLPRRDSDALGSLAGTPTEDRHMDFSRPRPGNGNAFRDELARQDKERF